MKNEIKKTVDTFEDGYTTYYLDQMSDGTFNISHDEHLVEKGYDEITAKKEFEEIKERKVNK